MKYLKRIISTVLALMLTITVVGMTDVVNAKAAERAAAPVSNRDSGYYDEAFTLTLTSATPGTQIYYTTDPDAEWSRATWDLYTGPIAIACNTTVKCITMGNGIVEGSEIVKYEYNIGSMATGYLYWSMETGDGILASWISSSPTSLKYAVTTTAEWNEIDKGSKLTVRLTMDKTKEVSASDMALITADLNGGKVAQFYDFKLYKRMNLGGEALVKKPNMPTYVTTCVPVEAFNMNPNMTRIYMMKYISDGKVVSVPVLSAGTNLLYYTIPESTTYALVYYDFPKQQ